MRGGLDHHFLLQACYLSGSQADQWAGGQCVSSGVKIWPWKTFLVTLGMHIPKKKKNPIKRLAVLKLIIWAWTIQKHHPIKKGNSGQRLLPIMSSNYFSVFWKNKNKTLSAEIMNLGAVFRSKPLGDGKTVMTSRQAHRLFPEKPGLQGTAIPTPGSSEHLHNTLPQAHIQ